MRSAVFTLILLLCLIPICSHAGMKEIIAEGEYVMGEGETPEVAAEKAKKNAVRHAAEQAGAFVKSYTKVRNMTLEDDVVEVIANHAMKITILAEEDTKVGKRAYRYYTKIKAVVSDEEIEANLKRIQEDRHLVEAYKKLHAEYNQQMKETEKLKKKLAEATGNERKEVLVKIGTAEAIFKATLWYEQGERLFIGKEEQAIDAFTKAIELNPKFSAAYFERAKKYSSLANTERVKNKSQNASGKTKMNKDECFNFYKNVSHYYKMAVIDLNSVIALNPALVDAYKERASVYDSLADITVSLYLGGCVNWDDWVQKYLDIYSGYGRKTIEDCTAAIKLSPNDPELYVQRADAYVTKIYLDSPQRFRFAIEDLSKAIDITRDARKLGDTHRMIKLKRYYMKRAFYYGLAGMKNLEAADKETLKVNDNDLLQYYRNNRDSREYWRSPLNQAEIDDWMLLEWTERKLAPELGIAPEQQITTKLQREVEEKDFVLSEKVQEQWRDMARQEAKKLDELNKKIAKSPEDPNNYLERATRIRLPAQPATPADIEYLRSTPADILREMDGQWRLREKEAKIEDYTMAIKLFAVKPEIYKSIRAKFTLAEAYAGRASVYENKWSSYDEKFVRSPEKAVADYTEAIKIVKNIQKTECAAVGASSIKDCEKVMEKKYSQYERNLCVALGVPNLKECKETLEKDTGKYKEIFKKCGDYCKTITGKAMKFEEKKSAIQEIISYVSIWLGERAALSEELGHYQQALEDYTELCNMNVRLSSAGLEDTCKAVQRLK